MAKELIDMKHSYTSNGKPVRLLCTDGPGEYCVVGVSNESVMRWYLDGRYNVNGTESCCDLIRVPTKHEGWINLYKDNNGLLRGTAVFESKEEAINYRNAAHLATIRIEWEE